MLVAILLLGGAAGWFWQRQQRLEDARNLAQESQRTSDSDTRLALAVQAAERAAIPETLSALFNAVGAARTLGGHQESVYRAAFSPDGARIVTASADNTARVWEAKTRRLLHTLQGHQGRVFQAAFLPDSARIVTASRDKTARVYFLRFDDLLRVAKERLPITPPASN